MEEVSSSLFSSFVHPGIEKHCESKRSCLKIKRYGLRLGSESSALAIRPSRFHIFDYSPLCLHILHYFIVKRPDHIAIQTIRPEILCVNPPPPFPARGVLPEKLSRVCGPLPKTLTLFMTKICDIPYPIYDLTKNSKPYL